MRSLVVLLVALCLCACNSDDIPLCGQKSGYGDMAFQFSGRAGSVLVTSFAFNPTRVRLKKNESDAGIAVNLTGTYPTILDGLMKEPAFLNKGADKIKTGCYSHVELTLAPSSIGYSLKINNTYTTIENIVLKFNSENNKKINIQKSESIVIFYDIKPFIEALESLEDLSNSTSYEAILNNTQSTFRVPQ